MQQAGWRDFLFSFRGRTARGRFWLYNAIAVPLLALLVVAFWAYALSIPGAYENGGPTPFPSGPLGMAGAVLFFALLTVILVAGTAITVRRLHDRNKPWWWILVFLCAPDALLTLAQVLDEIGTANASLLFILQVGALALGVWGCIELGFLRGSAGANRFGPDPLAAG
ncbi:MAG TPA: DUF805 domain-containing protein [Rhizomicrobium sp.]|nr:DUF805 domain-containing protein [Rhizomicrobium sp.]